MKKQPYYFEIKDILVQFVSAFNDVVINRYNKSRAVVDKIRVRYVYSPKQRVIHDLINKSQHITLPCVAISISTVERDAERIFNKIYGMYENTEGLATSSTFLPSPVPINIGVNMSILTKYQTDMDQIVSNFVPYANPYIVISWKVPSELSQSVKEIRTEVLWSGTLSYTYPDDQQATDPYRVSVDTTFTVKGWLFPSTTITEAKNILTIDTNFTPLTGFDYI